MMKSLFRNLSLIACLASPTLLWSQNLDIIFVSFHETDAASAAAAAADPPITEASDKGYTDLLSAQGHQVTRWLTRGAPTADDAAVLNAADLVIISRAVSSTHYGDGGAEFWNIAITSPVMNLGGYTFRNSRLNWTDGGTMLDSDGPVTLTVADTSHPIFVGVNVAEPYADLIAGERGVSFNTDNVVGGTVLATAADTAVAGGAAIFEFEAGATVNNGQVLAGPRLAFLTGSRELNRTSETAGFYDLTPSGQQMFLNAVDYMGSQSGAPALLVDLDASGLDEGAITAWDNAGSVGGTFTAAGDPQVKLVDQVKAVELGSDWFVGPTAPDEVTGANPRTVQAWVHNFTIEPEETIFSWGRRGGPDGSNLAFTHGSHPTFGAVGHWGGSDIGWNEREERDIWTNIAYTQDGSETRVYVNGVLANAETIAVDTHAFAEDGTTPLPFVIGSQNNGDGSQGGQLSTVSISKIRVYAGALSAEAVHANYNASAAAYGRAEFQPGADGDGDGINDELEMQAFGNLAQTGEDDLDGDGLTNAEEAVAGSDFLKSDSDGDGFSDGDEVAAGSDPNNAGSVPPTPTEVLVSLDAAGLEEGAITSWANTGTLGGSFEASGDPMVETITGAKGVTLDGEGDWLVGPLSVPSIEGGSGRTVEAWVYNPEIADEETVVSWGRRGGPDGSNVSFNHGAHPTFGAVGHWGGSDIGWNGTQESAIWSHVVYTQDGNETRVYTNGVLADSESPITLATHSGQAIVVGAQWDGDGVTVNEGLSGSLSVGLVRIYSNAISDEEVVDAYNEQAAAYGRAPIVAPPIVVLDARDFQGVGPLSAWTNTGTLGGSFAAEGDPQIEDIDSVRAVTLDGTGDWLVGPVAPDSVAGSNPRTIEAWVKNPTIDDEETVFSWGRRGGPDGSNVSFNHGAHPTFGAVGHWGGSDIGWNGDQEADIWTYIAYTQDGDETRVYTNGLLSDSEAPVTLASHTLADDGVTPLPFVVGNQNDGNGTISDPLSGSMSIAVVRVYEGALGELAIADSYNADAASFGRQTFVVGADDDNDGLADDYELATFGNLDQTGDGDPDGDGLTNVGEAAAGTDPNVADSDGDGFSDKAEIDGGSDPLLASSFPATPVELLVELQSADLAEGVLSSWANTGTLTGDFTASGDPTVEVIEGVKGVTLDGDGDWLVGPVTPSTIEGASTRSITAWIYNPTVAVEETVVSWGRRGGPDGTNVSFNHGTHNAFGAVGHWGNGPDIGWDPSTDVDDADTGLGEEEAGIWTHIAYTQDGSTTRVYTNGSLTKADEGITLNTHAGLPVLVGSQWEGDGVTPNAGLAGSLSIGELRIYDGALSAEEIASQFNAAAANYGRVASLKPGSPNAVRNPHAPLDAPTITLSKEGASLEWSQLSAGSYVIEFSETLRAEDWVSLGAATPENGEIRFTHEGQPSADGFYRIRPTGSND